MYSYAVLIRKYDELKEKYKKQKESIMFLEIENELLSEKEKELKKQVKQLEKESQEYKLLLDVKVDDLANK